MRGTCGGTSLRTRSCWISSGSKGSDSATGVQTGFLEDDQRKDIATIDPFRMPVDDVFGGISDGVSALLGFAVPINQRAGTTDIDNFGDKFFEKADSGVPSMSASSTNSVSASADAGNCPGSLKVGSRRKIRPTKPSAVRAEALKKGGAVFVGEIFLVVLTIETRQIFFSGGFDGIFTGEDIPRPLPGKGKLASYSV